MCQGPPDIGPLRAHTSERPTWRRGRASRLITCENPLHTEHYYRRRPVFGPRALSRRQVLAGTGLAAGFSVLAARAQPSTGTPGVRILRAAEGHASLRGPTRPA